MKRDRQAMLGRIRGIAADAIVLHRGCVPPEDCLSDQGWLALVGVPWLLQELAQRDEQGQGGDAEGQPGAEGVGLAQSPVEFVLAEEAKAGAARVVVAGNPVAQRFVAHLAKLMGVSVWVHGVEWPRQANTSLAGKSPSPAVQPITTEAA